MKIKSIEILVIGPEDNRYTWSHDIPEQYQSNTIIKIFTDTDIVGIAGVWNACSYDYDKYTAESLRHLIPILIDKDPLNRDELLYELRPRVFPQPPGGLALIDNALWDIQGKFSNMPVYKLIGNKRDKIKSYASTVMYDNIDTYLNIIDEMKNNGFSAVKFHTWCIPDKDLELAKEARKCFPDMSFMLDAENNYDLSSSLYVAKELEKLNFTWFEAPLPDYEFSNYRELTQKVGIKIIPSGNWVVDLERFSEAINTKVWTATRTDMAMMGGITYGKKAMELSEEANMNCEIMSWGYTLPSVANLHLMLSSLNCSYYEQPLPYDTFEFGMKDILRTKKDGYVYGPEKSGLGVEVDWDQMKRKCIHSIYCDKKKLI